MNLLMPASAHLDQPVAAAGDQLAAALPAEGQHTGLVTLQLPHALRRAATLPSRVLLSAAQYLVTLTSARLHIRTTASPPPVATRRSAGLKAAHHTPRVWPRNTAT